MADASDPGARTEATPGPADRQATRRALALIALAGIALRLAFSLGYWVDQPLTRDEREYLSLARSLAAGDGFAYDAVVAEGPVDPFGRAPGYPAFLAIAGGGGTPTASVPALLKVTQSVVGGLGVVLVGLLAWRLAGPRAARLAALVAAAYPPLVWIAASALSEAIFWPLGLGVAWLFDRAAREPRGLASGVACGVLGGVAVLIRPAMILFFPLAAAWLLLRRRPALVAALAAGSLLVVTPWTARNYHHYGRFVLVASEGGVTFWTGNNALARGEGDLAANPDIRRAQIALRAEYPDLSEEEMEPIYYREALAWIRSHPVEWAVLEARKLLYLVVPIGPSYTLHSRLYLVTSWISYGVLLPFALTGGARLGTRRGRSPGLWLLVGSAVAVCLVFFAQERFRIPVIDPALAICAGALAGPRRQAETS
jgi:4-amino-4-deoxy-L-arabinose transferase-like glycosyltransferase